MPNKLNAIWITGASSGIGKELAKEFARVGANVYASARRTNMLELLKKELEAENLQIKTIPCNVASSANVEQTVKQILSETKIDCLINNAGVTSFKKAEDNSLNEIKEIIDTNLLGAIYAIKSVLPSMIENKNGTIINIISVVAKKIFYNSSAYTASKSGLLSYADCLREEVRKHNIRIINVLPGATSTPIWPEKVLRESKDRMMEASDIARLIVSLYLNDTTVVPEEIVLRPIKGDL
jgi:short-subunit dehydrogenase